jgi:hypothetical protein
MADTDRAPDRGAGHFAIAFDRPLTWAGGGLAAFAARDPGRRTDLMALRTRPGWPPAAQAMASLAVAPVEGVLCPLGHGVARLPASMPGAEGEEALFVFAPAPPGPSLAAEPGPWSEAALLDLVLRPAALALARLAARRLTHRAIHPGNLFRARPAGAAVLGCAWAAPPAALQDPRFEPPYSAMCLPCGRGEGSIADDVYALGVTLLTLALGGPRMAGLDPVAVVRRKLALGSFAALAGEARVPPGLGDLIRGMLADDPEHRPTPLLLTDTAAARARRVAARPPHRASRPIEIAGHACWDARGLAHAMALAPTDAVAALREGQVENWLRRGLGETALAARVEEAIRAPDDHPALAAREASLVTRSVAILDPLAPLCRDGVAVWPDGLPAAIAAAACAPAEPGAQALPALTAIVEQEAAVPWAEARGARGDPPAARREARRLRALSRPAGPAPGALRLAYGLNRLLACASPLLGPRVVLDSAGLLRALDAAAPTDPAGASPPMDEHIAAFVCARSEMRLEAEVARLAEKPPADAVARLAMFARLQARLRVAPVPRLAAWLAAPGPSLLSAYRARDRRERLAARLASLTERGDVPALLAVIEDPGERERDARAWQVAEARRAAVARDLARLSDPAAIAARAAAARALGQEVAAGLAALALACAVLLRALA